MPGIFFLKESGRTSDLLDYKPYPVSSAFGAAVPLMVYGGFKLFGLTNKGLRFFFIIITGVTNLFLVSALFKATSYPVGLTLGGLYVCNINNYIMGRSAIHENLLTCIFTGLICSYVYSPGFILAHINPIVFLIGSTILIKPNFFLYSSLLVLSIVLAEWPFAFNLKETILWYMGGFLFFEGAQLIWLRKLGVARWRYYNLIQAIKNHSGHKDENMHVFKPDIKGLPRKITTIFSEWYGINIPKTMLTSPLKKAIVTTIIFGVGVTSWYLDSGSNTLLLQLVLFLSMFILSIIPFFVSIKRFISIFPVIILVIGLFLQATIDLASLLSHGLVVLIHGGLYAFLFVYLVINLKKILKLNKDASIGIEENSKALDLLLPENSGIYSHCYGVRFFWQSVKHRFFSADDQIQDNQMIVDRAHSHGGRYLLLSLRGGLVNLSSSEKMTFLNSFQSGVNDSGHEDHYVLFDSVEEITDSKFNADQIKENLYGMDESSVLDLSRGLSAKPRVVSEMIGVRKLLRGIECHNIVKEALKHGKRYAALPVNDCLVDIKIFELIKKIPDHLIPEDCITEDGFGLFELKSEHTEFKPDATILLDFLYKKASSLKQDHLWDEAKDLFLYIKQSGFHYEGTCFHLGELFLKAADDANALKYFERCLKCNPGHFKASQYRFKLQGEGEVPQF